MFWLRKRSHAARWEAAPGPAGLLAFLLILSAGRLARAQCANVGHLEFHSVEGSIHAGIPEVLDPAGTVTLIGPGTYAVTLPPGGGVTIARASVTVQPDGSISGSVEVLAGTNAAHGALARVDVTVRMLVVGGSVHVTGTTTNRAVNNGGSGKVTCNELSVTSVGDNGTGRITVSGGQVDVNGTLKVSGDFQQGDNIVIESGGQLTAKSLRLGDEETNDSAEIVVRDGVDNALSNMLISNGANTAQCAIGAEGPGVLRLANGASVAVLGSAKVGGSAPGDAVRMRVINVEAQPASADAGAARPRAGACGIGTIVLIPLGLLCLIAARRLV